MRRSIIIIVLVIGLIGSVFFFLKGGRNCETFSVNLTSDISRTIILVGIGDTDRSQLASYLLAVDSCEPAVVGIDAVFFDMRTHFEDSLLENAFRKVRNDIIPFKFNRIDSPVLSLERFRNNVLDQGYVNTDIKDGVISHFTPLKELGGKVYESFALKIVKKYDPSFNGNISVNESIPIKFTRTDKQFLLIDAREFWNVEKDSLKGKIVLLGFLGPGMGDKKFTPIRYAQKYLDTVPDTYGVVIIANEITTLLEERRKNK
ncbi:MAG: CHASE2 domain-containing protein [Chitinophagaceae bacterium]